MRFEAWAAFMSGACGHTYGANGLWQFFDPHDDRRDRQRVDPEPPPWWEALRVEGAVDVARIRAFFERLGFERWRSLAPARELVSVDGHPASDEEWRDPYLLLGEGDAVVYVPEGNNGRSIRIAAAAPPSARWTALWYDPRTGAEREAWAPSLQSGSDALPVVPDEKDWVFWMRRTG